MHFANMGVYSLVWHSSWCFPWGIHSQTPRSHALNGASLLYLHLLMKASWWWDLHEPDKARSHRGFQHHQRQQIQHLAMNHSHHPEQWEHLAIKRVWQSGKIRSLFSFYSILLIIKQSQAAFNLTAKLSPEVHETIWHHMPDFLCPWAGGLGVSLLWFPEKAHNVSTPTTHGQLFRSNPILRYIFIDCDSTTVPLWSTKVQLVHSVKPSSNRMKWKVKKISESTHGERAFTHFMESSHSLISLQLENQLHSLCSNLDICLWRMLMVEESFGIICNDITKHLHTQYLCLMSFFNLLSQCTNDTIWMKSSV